LLPFRGAFFLPGASPEDSVNGPIAPP
jgi:hypothetical protein